MTGEFIPLPLAADWIAKLWSKLQRIANKRKEDIEAINNIVSVNPFDLAKYYIEPDCQDINPADTEVEDLLDSHQPIMTKIDEFLARSLPNHPGYNVLFVLGDAGMGKTALLTMLKLMHLTSFWPKSNACVLTKLNPDTLDEIKQIGNKVETILLLDSLDEDPSAYGRVKDRLIELLDATGRFYRVIITCRTQFFPDSDSDLERINRIQVGGYKCRAKYLSFFDDKHVQAFLKKRFPKKYKVIPQRKLIENAEQVIRKMGSLRCRPMLLAYIDDLMPSPELKAESSEFTIYSCLVSNWLQREHVKTKIPVKDLFRACELLAAELTMRQSRSISEQQLDDLIQKYEELEGIKAIDIKGRSLLNRNSEGDYRFAHNSIKEFLVAHRMVHDTNWRPEQQIPMSDLSWSFFVEGSRASQRSLRLGLIDINQFTLRERNLSDTGLNEADLSGADLTGTNLSRANLNRANLSRANLSRANLTNADLTDADLTDADLNRANLTDADLTDANLNRANLRRVKLTGAKLIRANLNEADLSSADLSKAHLNEAKLKGARLYFADLSKADLTGANVSKADLRGADLRGVGFSKADLTGADLSKADLDFADLIGTDLSEADLRVAKLTGADLSVAKLTGAKLNKANLTGASLNRANLTGADLNEAKLRGANLNRANLIGTNLISADLTGADLTGADLGFADLSGARLNEAKLNGANLINMKIDRSQLIFFQGIGYDISRAIIK